MRYRVGLFVMVLCLCGAAEGLAQRGPAGVHIFGFFQNEFLHESSKRSFKFGSFDSTLVNASTNSFVLQQLNLLFRRDFGRRWRTFVNLEVLNTFSTSRQTGAINLEEAWARFRLDEKLNVKVGLQIPTFNNFNEIKNRTPLLPYIIRPLVYESSFNEIIDIEDFFPNRGFVQVYGFLPATTKLDYALYLGNTTNISRRGEVQTGNTGQSGIDTTNAVLVGGRVGLRLNELGRLDELKVGVSMTRDVTNEIAHYEALLPRFMADVEKIPRFRFGLDFSFHLGGFFFEGETISVTHDDGAAEVNIDKSFYYGTLGYELTEQLKVYVSYWKVRQYFTGLTLISDGFLYVFGPHDTDFPPDIANAEVGINQLDIAVPTAGIAYQLNDRITVKAQYAFADVDEQIKSLRLAEEAKTNFYTIAASVFF